VLTSSLAGLAESPLWDVDEQRLYWIDNAEGLVFRCTSDGRELEVWPLGRPLTSIALRTEGGLVATRGSTVQTVDLSTGQTEVLFDAEPGPGFGFNDGKIDRQGRLVSGLVERVFIYPALAGFVDKVQTHGRLYRLDHDGTASELADDIAMMNGPCFSPEGTTFYCGDSWARRIYAFDYDTASGAASNRRILVSFEGDSGLPDGSTVDEQGYLWVSAYEGGEIRRFSPDGTLDRRVRMPIDSPTSVMFGGPDLDILFVTSAGAAPVPGHEAPLRPLGGSVFAVRGLGVRGLPERRFGP
jgi:sugar lactone lactonase YvrE